ncbi:MAG TPA: hypothetical protein DF383_04900 [Deltaproteobacteria bacterium]|nr:hypothetical protein [Deltaproteobacteria bacterium]
MGLLLDSIDAGGYGNGNYRSLADGFHALAARWNQSAEAECTRELRRLAGLAHLAIAEVRRSYHDHLDPLLQIRHPEWRAEQRGKYISERYKSMAVYQVAEHARSLGAGPGLPQVAQSVLDYEQKPFAPGQLPFAASFYGSEDFPSDPRAAGSKALGLHRLTKDFPVPPGFVLPPRAPAYRLSESDIETVKKAVADLEQKTGKTLGKGLKLAVRSGGAFVMPGAMETSLNIDSIDKVLELLPQIYQSWDSKAARSYRLGHGIPDHWGTPINIMAMVETAKNEQSGAGVIASRPGQAKLFYARQALGSEVVGGRRQASDPLPGSLHEKLMQDLSRMEEQAAHPLEVEFGIEDNHIYYLQVRPAELDLKTRISWYAQRVREGKLSKEEAIHKLGGTPKIERDWNMPVVDAGDRQAIATTYLASGMPRNAFLALDAEGIARIQANGGLAVYAAINPDAAESTAEVMQAGAALVNGGNALSHLMGVIHGVEGSMLSLEFSSEEGQIRLKDGSILKAGAEVTLDPQNGKLYPGHLPIKEIPPEKRWEAERIFEEFSPPA